MKIALIIGGIIAMLLLGVWFMAPESDNEVSGVVASAQTASSKAEQGEAYLYDVRTPEEFNSGNATGSINFDNELIQAGQLPDAPKNAEIYVYCRSGNRSAEATSVLTNAGYTNVTDLGGLDTMRAAGLL